MKCTVRLLALLVLLPLLFVGCNDPQTNDPEPVYYTVTFDSNGGAAVESQHIIEGEKAVKPPRPDREQRSNFLGWYLGDTEWNFDTVVTANITLVAKWQNVYKITFSTEGLYPDDTTYTNEGEHITKKPDPTKENSRFLGWYFGDKKWNFDTDTPTSDMTLTAKWEQIPTYTVTFNSNGGSAVLSVEVPIGEKIAEPTVTRTNAVLIGWFVGDSDVQWDFDEDVVTEPITLRAEWIITTPPMPL